MSRLPSSIGTRNQKAKLLGSCSGCRKTFSFGCETYVSPNSEKEKLCEACAILVYPMCVQCGKPGIDDMAKISDKTYHTYCLHCVVCSKTIAGKAYKIQDDFLCCDCHADVQDEALKSNRLAKRGDKKGAAKIRKELLSKGLQVSDWEKEFPSEKGLLSNDENSCTVSVVHKLAIIRCAMCSKVVTGKAAEVGKSMLCFHCASGANAQIHQARKLLAMGNGEAADDIFHVLAKHGIDLECSHFSRTSCSFCSEPIHGEGAEMGKKTLCPRCADNVQCQTQEAHALAAQGDIAGVSKIMHAMETQGLVSPAKTVAMPARAQKGQVCCVCHESITALEGQMEKTLVCLSCRRKTKLKGSSEEGGDDGNTSNTFASLMASSLKEQGLGLPPVLTSRLGTSQETSNISSPKKLIPIAKEGTLDSPLPLSSRPLSASSTKPLAKDEVHDGTRNMRAQNETVELPSLIHRKGKDSKGQDAENNANNDGAISPSRTKSSQIEPLKKMSVPKDRLVETFRSWDLNGNGQICEQELGKVFHKLGIPTEDIHKTFSSIDSNKDGHIDYREFVEWLYVSPAIRQRIK